MRKHPMSWTAAVAALALLAGGGLAQPNYLEPSSVLVYPVVDSRAGAGFGTVVSVTNTNGNTVRDPRSGRPRGTVQVRFYYATQAGSSGWMLTDIPEILTPNDILTVLAGDHNPQAELGWLFIVAEDPETDNLIDFDYLIGDEVLVNAANNRTVALPAMGFKSVTEENVGAPPAFPGPTPNASSLGYWFSDAHPVFGNGNGSADFNGQEYVHWPDRILVSSFLELANLQVGTADLLLLTTLGRDFRVTLRFLIYDNEEDQFSRTFNFTCWTQVPLEQISNVVRSLGGSQRPATPQEELQVGWMRINGEVGINPFTRRQIVDPPFVGAIIQRVIATPNDFEFGHVLHKTGQNGFSHNLPPTTITVNWP